MLALWQVVRLWSYHNTILLLPNCTTVRAREAMNRMEEKKNTTIYKKNWCKRAQRALSLSLTRCERLWSLGCVLCTQNKTRRIIIFLYQQKIIVRLYSIFYYIQRGDKKREWMSEWERAIKWNSVTFISLAPSGKSCGCRREMPT